MMNTPTRLTFLFALCALLAACATGGKLQTAGNTEVLGLRVTTTLDWARYTSSRQETWTIDGTALNQLRIIRHIKPREHVFLLGKERKNQPQRPWFKPGARPDELQDLLLAALREQGWSEVDAEGLRPAKLGGTDGLRFEFRMAQGNGLRYSGMAAIAESNGLLTLVYWQAPAEYYYGRDAAAVSALIDSLSPAAP